MKRTLSLILAALMLTSSLSVGIFAEKSETPTESPSETSEPETEAPETDDHENVEPDELEEAESSETEEEDEEPPVENPNYTVPHSVTFTESILESGLVLSNRNSAKEGEVVVLRAFEREFEQYGKKYKYDFYTWGANVDVKIVQVSKTVAFFYMPDEDVVIHPIFNIIDITEYYDWDSVVKDIDKLRRNQTLEVNMGEETTIPDSVLKALAGTDADVTFVTDDCVYTINGMDISMNNAEDAADGYSLTYADYELTKAQRGKIRYSDLLAVKINVNTDHKVKVNLSCFAEKGINGGYLYRISGTRLTFISAIEIKNGEALIPVTESGTYVVTYQVLANTLIQIDSASNNTMVMVDDKLVSLSAVANEKLTFKIDTSGKLLFKEYINTYTDVKNHKYKSQIDFVNARGLLDGVSDGSWQPNAGITTGDFLKVIARLRGIPDKDAYDYCTQLSIFSYECEEDEILTRNELSIILTNFINHLIEYQKSFGGYTMRGFDNNSAAWVGARFRELKNNSSAEFNWNKNATRAEAAYLLNAVIVTIIEGE